MYTFQLTPSLPIFLIVFLISAFIFVYTVRMYVRRNRQPAILALSTFLCGIAIWQLINFFTGVVTNETVVLLGKNIVNATAVPIISYSVLAISFAYSNKDKYFLHIFVTCFIHIFLLNTLLFFRPELLYESRGLVEVGPHTIGTFQFNTFVALERNINVVFKIYSLIMMSIVICGLIILVRHYILGSERVNRSHLGIMLFSTLAPLGAIILLLAGVVSPVWNPVDFSLAITAVGLSIGVTRYQLFKEIPASRVKIADIITDPVIILDNNYHIVYYNDRAKELADDQVDKRISTIDSSFKSVHEPVQRSLDNPEDNINTTINRNGTARHFVINTNLIEDSKYEVLGYIILFREVTELIEKKNQIEQYNKRLEEFSSILAHDLRSPLSVAQMSIEKGKEEGNVIQYSDRIISAIGRINQLVDSMMKLTRIESMDTEKSQVDLSTVADQAWIITDTAEAVLNIDNSMPVVTANQSQVYQMFENFFRNAVEHAGEDAVITVGPIDSSGFYVEDNGDGIPIDKRDRVFDLGVTYAQEGTGLGLTIIQRVVKQHNWTIKISDSQTGGARFEVRFSNSQ
ncbi:histidine kinase N-terminal 7TM domain-containing protein [Halorubrum ezzemoulense]|uniref:sensor histidine kinase n=1 Tax=Halorubrum ezzemoulense TaxID=337243 RepID=UPI00232F7F02|nr:ATP-binding protein [Halorubrum ezzemoulense]MDB9281525.1 histidine kinase N-terminal 7TM domain-containing protein [Halorubrum ezzemoulense]MDB9285213.1 histidine kinase N-terminal 7TM domain-containing protein [Halorubrum ezzemoulense]